MADWKSVLKADPTAWLLGEDNPSVRLLTLTEILDRPSGDPDVRAARAEIMERGIVPRILARQNPDGSWDKPDALYTAKYKGAVWQLLILAELGADGNDPRVRKAGEFILKNSQDRAGGGFAMHRSVKSGGGRATEVIPCLTGNMAWSLIHLGFGDDPRLARAIDWIAKVQRYDDGEAEAPRGEPYEKFRICWGKHSCHMGVVKALKALAGIPPKKRSAPVRRSIGEGVEYLLKHHIYKKSHDLSRIAKPGWLRFGFPLMYQDDILEILDILLRLGVKDPRMREAVDIVASKQDAAGTWVLENTFNGRFQVDIEKKGKPSKWITLRALNVLKMYYS